ncbi:MAG: helix-turn-helix domain-containing protein [Promethearchaeota archaeon]
MNNKTSSSIDKIQLLEEKKLKEELRRLLSLKGKESEEVLNSTWNSLKKMQEELKLPSLHSIKEHYYFYQKLEEIRQVLNLPNSDFNQLYQLYVEISNLREHLGFHETTPISEIISFVQREPLERLASLGVKYNSLLLKILIMNSMSDKRNSMEDLERPALINDLERILFEVLKSYGPLTRSELVHFTGIPRSSIYNCLQRLVVKGFVVQYTEKRSRTGRPTTVFDAII